MSNVAYRSEEYRAKMRAIYAAELAPVKTTPRDKAPIFGRKGISTAPSAIIGG